MPDDQKPRSCGSCGREVRMEASFCPFCGASISDSTQKAEPRPESNASSEPSPTTPQGRPYGPSEGQSVQAAGTQGTPPQPATYSPETKKQVKGMGEAWVYLAVAIVMTVGGLFCCCPLVLPGLVMLLTSIVGVSAGNGGNADTLRTMNVINRILLVLAILFAIVMIVITVMFFLSGSEELPEIFREFLEEFERNMA
ncbi:MAG: zinc-ribbon domain-containing protein [Planctomycetota bacterium]|nr:zinc-ribbon domain-containing protein [Planctomycetota bacterium]